MSNKIRVLVCGSRDLTTYNDYGNYKKHVNYIFRKLDDLFLDRELIIPLDNDDWVANATFISGGARGVDTIAEEYAVYNGCPIEIYEADWEKYGKRAGPIRNKQMLEEGKPDLVVAFYKNINNKSKGTSHMVKIAKEAGVEVLEFGYE